MGNCGGTQKELTLTNFMQSTYILALKRLNIEYHPTAMKIDTTNYELSKKVMFFALRISLKSKSKFIGIGWITRKQCFLIRAN